MSILSSLSIGSIVPSDFSVYPLKFEVVDEINRGSLYTYTIEENPALFSEFRRKNDEALNTHTCWGTLKYKSRAQQRTFNLNFAFISATQKNALKAIYDYHLMIRFYYMGRESLTDYANCIWQGGFKPSLTGSYWSVSFDLMEVGY